MEFLFKGLWLGALLPLAAGAEVFHYDPAAGGTANGFTGGAGWPGGVPPTAGHDYVVDGAVLRTGSDSKDATFLGDSLTLKNGAALARQGSKAAQQLYTIGSLVLDGGAVVNASATDSGMALAGEILLRSAGGVLLSGAGEMAGTFFSARTITVLADIGGSGQLLLGVSDGVAATASTVTTLAGSHNAYTGGTRVVDGVRLRVAETSRLGGNVAGNDVVLDAASGVTLTSATNMGAAQKLILAEGMEAGAVVFDFAGEMRLAGFSFDAGTSWLDAGNYAVADLNALYGGNVFAGTGSVTVVPEPSTYALAAGVLGVALLATRRKRGKVGS